MMKTKIPEGSKELTFKDKQYACYHTQTKPREMNRQVGSSGRKGYLRAYCRRIEKATPPEAKPTKTETAWERGVAKAMQIEDVNDYTIICYALSEVLAEKGLPIPALDLCGRHHNEIVMFSSGIKEYGARMPEAIGKQFNSILETRDFPKKEPIYSRQSLGFLKTRLEPPSENDIKNNIDWQIKRKYPNLRRGTKRYKELMLSVWDKGEKLLLGDKAKEATKMADILQEELDGELSFGKSLKYAEKQIEHWSEHVAIAEFLNGETANTQEAKTVIEGWSKDVKYATDYIQKSIDDLRKKATEWKQ